jgi:hypothetical protein
MLEPTAKEPTGVQFTWSELRTMVVFLVLLGLVVATWANFKFIVRVQQSVYRGDDQCQCIPKETTKGTP